MSLSPGVRTTPPQTIEHLGSYRSRPVGILEESLWSLEVTFLITRGVDFKGTNSRKDVSSVNKVVWREPTLYIHPSYTSTLSRQSEDTKSLGLPPNFVCLLLVLYRHGHRLEWVVRIVREGGSTLFGVQDCVVLSSRDSQVVSTVRYTIKTVGTRFSLPCFTFSRITGVDEVILTRSK